ncbi:MAG: ExbD/TolR family protein [Candidatus Eutrophobiaceae bacterium]
MNLKPENRQDALIDITPMIDVVFLLLIFFMVSTTFDEESELNISLPEASREVKSNVIQAVRVAIDKDGEIFINKMPLLDADREALRNALSTAAIGLDEPPVILSVDREAEYDKIMRVMDAARAVGLAKITFTTKVLVDD